MIHHTLHATPLFALAAALACGPAGQSTSGASSGSGAAAPAEVQASVETEPVAPGMGEVDDPAIWVHPSDPAKSLVLGTIKESGLAAYRLDGSEAQRIGGAELNNVDVRYGVEVGGQLHDLALATNRDSYPGTIAAFLIDPQTGALTRVEPDPIAPAVKGEIYGACMYRSARTGELHVFFNTKDGEIQQWRIDGAALGITATLVRELVVPSQPEACVADDARGVLFVGEEVGGIWEFAAEPDAPTDGALIARTAPEGPIEADLEGLALYYGPGDAGYLIASSQGADRFDVFARAGAHAHLGAFAIVDGDVDAVTHSDGVDVLGLPLGPDFPSGVFVTQDDDNGDHTQNFKLVPWERIAGAMDGLEADGARDPRRP